MCQGAVRRLCNLSERCHVRKVARLLARPLNVPRDASGNPEDVQVVALEQIPSEEEVYAPNVSLGPPPTPPAQYADFVILRPLQYRIAETLIEMWEEGQRRIKSEDVYERVLSTG